MVENGASREISRNTYYINVDYNKRLTSEPGSIERFGRWIKEGALDFWNGLAEDSRAGEIKNGITEVTSGTEKFSVAIQVGTGKSDTLLASGVLAAGAGHDILMGGAEIDLLIGGSGNDILEGGLGGDSLEGGIGNDYASYKQSSQGVVANLSDTAQNTGAAIGDIYNSIEGIVGSSFNDRLIGDAADNGLAGGAGHDTLEGGLGRDRLRGNDGYDYASYENAAAGVRANLSDRLQNTGEATGDRYLEIEGLIGSTFADHLTGDAASNGLHGYSGHDTLLGQAGADTLDGGVGDDTLLGGAGADHLIGSYGIDWASYADAIQGVNASLADGRGGFGSLSGGGAAAVGDTYDNVENLEGSHGCDVLAGDAGANWLKGIGGDDILQGGGGADTLEGGAGFNWASYANATSGVVANLAASAANAGEAHGDIYIAIRGLQGSQHADRLTGDRSGAGSALSGLGGNDILSAWAGNSHLDGGDGDDILQSNLGADVLVGGAGSDWASYANATSGVTANLANRWANTGEAAGDVYLDIRGLQGSQHGDHLMGDATARGNALAGLGGNDTLDGGYGGDHLDGGEGDDILRGGAGADRLVGGSGTDWVSYAYTMQGVSVSLANGGGYGVADAAGDTYDGIENVEGSQGWDMLAGDAGANGLSGLSGNDTLLGQAGNDTLDGGVGDDTLLGGAGADHLIGSFGIDWVSYADAAGGVNVSLAEGRGYHGSLGGGGADAAGDTYDNIENLEGSHGHDVLAGNAGSNWLKGIGGDDILQGGWGADTLDGGAGFNWASYANATSGVTANLANRWANTGEAAGDVYLDIRGLQGSQHGDHLTADATGNAILGLGGHDTLQGGAGGDALEGGEGSDQLAGGLGSDQLVGGGGADWFRFDAALGAGNVDTVTDFAVGQDSLVLARSVFTAFGPSSGSAVPSVLAYVAPGAFTTGAAATSTAHRLVYNSVTGALSYDADGVGGVAQVQFATLAKNLALNASAFMLI
ncbi:calcium-binding protein [Microvirga sp. VF16]|uniref:calcium-binding protein n=1 Tax=Microvirga sp. VF16 TaxID=2807101 RepID=UPI00193D0AEB|nr:calcium-binding protein [Microvirga sp. VF16]QRM31522.1 hypothetical protein JO965_11345 [Microvirga sp. VF16]